MIMVLKDPHHSIEIHVVSAALLKTMANPNPIHNFRLAPLKLNNSCVEKFTHARTGASPRKVPENSPIQPCMGSKENEELDQFECY